MKKLVIAALAIPGLAFASEFNMKEIPQNPEPGKCYSRVVVPAKYKAEKETVLATPESYTLKTIPAQYDTMTETVVVREASEKTVVIPATYKTIKEKYVSQGEKRIMVPVAPKFEYKTTRVMVKPEGYEWTKGKGPLQKIDHATGEILCYKKTPAVYKTIREKVLVKEASVVEKVIPAKYSYITKRVVDRPEQIVKKVIPEVTKTVTVKKMIAEPYTEKVKVPATYKTVTKHVLAEPSYTAWQSILCETNATPQKISQVQVRLKKLGFYKGKIDGKLGKGTMSAVKTFQRKNSLASGGLTEETLNKLSITL